MRGNIRFNFSNTLWFCLSLDSLSSALFVFYLNLIRMVCYKLLISKFDGGVYWSQLMVRQSSSSVGIRSWLCKQLPQFWLDINKLLTVGFHQVQMWVTYIFVRQSKHCSVMCPLPLKKWLYTCMWYRYNVHRCLLDKLLPQLCMDFFKTSRSWSISSVHIHDMFFPSLSIEQCNAPFQLDLNLFVAPH